MSSARAFLTGLEEDKEAEWEIFERDLDRVDFHGEKLEYRSHIITINSKEFLYLLKLGFYKSPVCVDVAPTCIIKFLTICNTILSAQKRQECLCFLCDREHSAKEVKQ